jgi:hypothetical protein
VSKLNMSRLVGIIALVIAFGCAGFLVSRIARPHNSETMKISLQPKPAASVEEVRRDLCSLADAEIAYQHQTGNYADIEELRQHGKSLPDFRWPYRYVVHVRDSQTFVVTAVSVTLIQNQPRIFTVDNQRQVQTKDRPQRVLPCN